MEANQNDHEVIRTAAMVKLGAAIDAQAVIARIDFEFRLIMAVEEKKLDGKYAEKLRKSLEKGLKSVSDSAQEILSIFSPEEPTGGLKRAQDIIDKAREEQE